MAKKVMRPKRKIGLACISPEQRKAISSMGGKAAHAAGKAHEFTPEEAREAGKKGGRVVQEQGKAHRFTPEEAKAARKKVGRKRKKRKAA
jgi:hypothetical protein